MSSICPSTSRTPVMWQIRNTRPAIGSRLRHSIKTTLVCDHSGVLWTSARRLLILKRRGHHARFKVFPIRMVGASPKAFSASQEIRKFFHAVCLDLILVETGVLCPWQCPMGVLGTQSTFLSMWGGVKMASWPAWWWQSHAEPKYCKRQFRGFLWNWRFPSFGPVDWMFSDNRYRCNLCGKDYVLGGLHFLICWIGYYGHEI